MIKRKIVIACLSFFAFFMLGSVPARADAATAADFMPVLRAMYRVDDAQAILSCKVAALDACRRNNASACQIAMAQAAVNDATNLLNTLNTMIARDTIIITAAPAGVVNTPSFATNSLAAQGAWYDFMTKEMYGHAILIPSGPVPKPWETALACEPFRMY